MLDKRLAKVKTCGLNFIRISYGYDYVNKGFREESVYLGGAGSFVNAF